MYFADGKIYNSIEEAMTNTIQSGSNHLGILLVSAFVLYFLFYLMNRYDLALAVFVIVETAVIVDMFVHGYLH